MSFPARFPGTCVDCGAYYHVGDPTTRADDDEGWVHASCADTDHPDPEPCTRCWLTICDCGGGVA